MQEQQIYDIGIIGGGPAGYTAAFQARKQGLSVVLFEKDKIGGVCLNKGCIPTKAILHSAEIYEEMKCAQDMGICVNEISFDYEKVVEHKDKIVEKIRKNLELALKNAGVKIVYGEAVILDDRRSGGQEGRLVNDINLKETPTCHCEEGVSPTWQSNGLNIEKAGLLRSARNDRFSENSQEQLFDNGLFADNETFLCQKFIIATGSEPKDFPTLKFDHEFVLSSDDILNLKKLPKNILIIGSGAIGIEWARIFSAFDVDVSIIETAEHLLPIADIEVSKRIERIFKSKKIKMYLSNTVEKIEDKKVYLKSGEILEPECVLLAVGRKPVILEDLRSGGQEGRLVNDSHVGASNDTPYLTHSTHFTHNTHSIIGDACGKIQLAHFAIKQAIKEVSGIDFDETLVPSVVYGNPEIAWVGKREQDLEEGTYQKSNLLISALGKSHCDCSTDGFIKILSQNGRIVGAHIVSKEASSLIQQITIAMQNNIAIDDLKKVCFAHPTYSEGIFECLNKVG